MKVSALVLVFVLAGSEPLATSSIAASTDTPAQYGASDRPCVVPSLLGMDRAAALSRLNDSHLTAGRIESRPAPQTPGTVIDQRPQPGGNLCEGGRVDVVISSGEPAAETPGEGDRRGSRTGNVAIPIAVAVGVAAIATILRSRGDKPVKVPDLLDKTVPAADQALKKARLRMGEVTMRESTSASLGTVLEQSPVSGTLVPRNTAVTLSVSQGAPIAQVPPQRADDTPPGVPTTPVEPSGTSTPPPTSPIRTGGRGAAVVPRASTPAPTSTPAAVAPTVTPPPPAPNSIQADPVVQPPTPVGPVSWRRWVWLFLLLKLASLLALVLLWKRRRARANVEGKTPAGEPPPVPWLAPRVTFVPRLDAGRQTVTAIDGQSGHSYELAYHIDPGIQHVRYEDRLERVGAPS